MAVVSEILLDLAVVQRQYFQLVDVLLLRWPPPHQLKDPDVHGFLYRTMFDPALPYLPPQRYQLRVLKVLNEKIMSAITDPEEDEISDDLMSLAAQLSVNLPSEILAAEEKSYVSYTFGDNEGISEMTSWNSVRILESRAIISGSGTTGLRTWEAALHLGAYLTTGAGRQHVSGKKVIELGAGTGLLSILCAKCLAAQHVLATDGDEAVVDAIKTNLFLNYDESSTMSQTEASVLRWGRMIDDKTITEDLGMPSYDLILGADVTYDKFVIPSLVWTLRRLLELAPSAEAIIGATIRNEQTFEAFIIACERNRLCVENISFEAAPIEHQRGPFYSTTTPLRIVRLTKPADVPIREAF